MSYRTRINGTQIFGNNEYYPEWIEFIKSQGIVVGEDGDYEGRITDVMGALNTIEDIVFRLAAEKESRIITADQARYAVKAAGLGDVQKGYDVIRENEKDHNPIFDFSWQYKCMKFDREDVYGLSITDTLLNVIDTAYIFMPIVFLKACGDCIEKASSDEPGRLKAFKVKEGSSILVSAG